MVGFLTERGIEGATVLEIGGGVGEFQVGCCAAERPGDQPGDLDTTRPRRRTCSARPDSTGRVNPTASTTSPPRPKRWRTPTSSCSTASSAATRTTRLLAAAAGHARQLLVFSHPPRNLLSSALIGLENRLHRLRGNDFRAFVHPPSAMVDVVSAQALTLQYRHRGFAWNVVGFAR